MSESKRQEVPPWAQEKIARLERELAEAKRDAERLDAINRECWHLIPVSDGFDSYYWEVYQSQVGKPDQLIAVCNNEDPRGVIDEAMRIDQAIKESIT